MKCLINVDGGMGKNVMLTALMPILKRKYDDIYVISPYFDIFKACSYVTDAFPPGQGSLYEELVLDDDCEVLWKEPYSNSRFIKKQCHLFDAWLEEFGIEDTTSELTPLIDHIREEFPQVAMTADHYLKEFGEKFIIVQFCGGHSPLEDQKDQEGNPIQHNEHQEFIKRNYFKGQELINALKEKYPDTTIVHYALPTETTYENCTKIEVPYLTYRLLAERAFKVVCTDSSLQHLSTGACSDVTVIWGETRPEHFGYECNKNICAKNVKNCQPYFKPLGVSPSIVKMPSVEEVMAKVEE